MTRNIYSSYCSICCHTYATPASQVTQQSTPSTSLHRFHLAYCFIIHYKPLLNTRLLHDRFSTKAGFRKSIELDCRLHKSKEQETGRTYNERWWSRLEKQLGGYGAMLRLHYRLKLLPTMKIHPEATGKPMVLLPSLSIAQQPVTESPSQLTLTQTFRNFKWQISA